MDNRIEWTPLEGGEKRIFELHYKPKEGDPIPIHFNNILCYGETETEQGVFVPTTTEYGYSPEIEKYLVTTITHHTSGDVRVTTHHDKAEYDQLCRKALGL